MISKKKTKLNQSARLQKRKLAKQKRLPRVRERQGSEKRERAQGDVSGEGKQCKKLRKALYHQYQVKSFVIWGTACKSGLNPACSE